MKFNSPVLGFLPLVLFGGYFFMAPSLMGPGTMVPFSSGAKLEVRFDDPPLENPQLEAARQAATYRMVTRRLNSCRSRHFSSYEDRGDIGEIYQRYVERNSDKYSRVLETQHADAGKVQEELREDLDNTGDGIIGGIHKTVIIKSRQKEMMEDVQRSIGGSGIRIVTDFPDNPTYSDCYEFMVKVGHGRYNIKL